MVTLRNKLISRSVSEDKSIKLRFTGGSWACMTFQHFKENDWWQVSITSDWGDWSYGWSRSGMGVNIYEFMSRHRNDLGYFHNKFYGGEIKTFSPEKTSKRIRKIIRQELNYWENKELYNELIFDSKDIEQWDEVRDYIENMSEELQKFLGEDFWELMVYEHNSRTVYFFNEIFPKFIPEIKKINKAMAKQ